MFRNEKFGAFSWAGLWGTFWSWLILAVFAMGFVGCPKWGVYNAEMTGRAELARAEQNRQIQIFQSEAKVKAATFEAQAEVERAKGVASANQIIGDSLAGNEAYLKYLWIQGLEGNDKEVIYIPTEANLPILEAGRFAQP